MAERELIHLRGGTSKTFDLGVGKRRLEAHIGAIHYKNDYATDKDWLDIDLTWEDLGNGTKQITKAPYELTHAGKKLTLKDKKTGEVSTIKLISVKPAGIPFEIIPELSAVRFQHILPSDKVPFEAQFKVTGKAPITRAFDDEGEVELKTSLVDGVLTEKLSQIRDKVTGRFRLAKGSIRIDPTYLTVQPSAKDTYVYKTTPTQNYSTSTVLNVYDQNNSTMRSFLEFDISAIPAGQTITSATLQLYYYGYVYTNPVGKTIWAYKLTRTDWVENQATWNIYKTDFAWTTPGGDYDTNYGGSTTFPASYGWMSWNVLSIIQDAYANSQPAEFAGKFAIETLTTGSTVARFYSKEYATESLRPKLVIEYEPAGGNALPMAINHYRRLRS